ncbi:MAG: hypothetical protein MZW92_12235 [Comamonadaceae bacterium]|nr:hypothetical protein [Comamonadaceae bacterium]
MHESEEPVVRPYWLVDDIEAALAACRGGGWRDRPPADGDSRPWHLRHLHPRRHPPRPLDALRARRPMKPRGPARRTTARSSGRPSKGATECSRCSSPGGSPVLRREQPRRTARRGGREPGPARVASARG